MSDLSQALVDAAAAVLPIAYCESMGIPEGSRDASGGRPEDWQVEARAAAGAVLDALAWHTAERSALAGTGPRVAYLNHEELVRLAAEVREVSS